MNIDLEKIKENKTTEELLEFGIINVDKSSGPTSFQVSEFLKKSLKLRKTSHFGTLDPKVTGVLPVSLNRACKLTGFFLGEDKEYVGIMKIHKEISIEKIEEKIKEKFLGKIIQTPPVKSRVKRQARPREIYSFELLEKDRTEILFRVECEGGTYIRKLIDDLGQELGIGAHMLELRRIRAGIFKEETIVNLYDFEKAINEYKDGNDKTLREIIIPAEIIYKLHAPIKIKKDNLKQIFTGKPLYDSDLIKKESFKEKEIITVFCEDKFIGLYEITNNKNVFAKPLFVMQPIRN